MKTRLITLEEANNWSVEKIQMAIGAKGKYLVEAKGFTEDEAKEFIVSVLSLDRALADKGF